MTNVTVWCDGSDEKKHPDILEKYRGGIAQYTADYLSEEPGFTAKASVLDDEQNGLSSGLMATTDVLVMYSHFFKKLPEEQVGELRQRVEAGMGIVLLHSALWLNAAQRLIGTCGYPGYREVGEWETVRTAAAQHPVCRNVPLEFTFPHSEMYSEPAGFSGFDEVLFTSRYEGGEESRSGLTWRLGKGRIFYFSPGHATYDVMTSEVYHTVVRNAVHWAAGEN